MNATAALIQLPPPARRFVDALFQRRVRVGAFVLVIAMLAAAYAWLSKPWYTAESTLLPPSESSDPFANLTGLIEGRALERVGLFTTSTASDIYMEVLKSRTLRETMINRFELKKVYDLK